MASVVPPRRVAQVVCSGRTSAQATRKVMNEYMHLKFRQIDLKQSLRPETEMTDRFRYARPGHTCCAQRISNASRWKRIRPLPSRRRPARSASAKPRGPQNQISGRLGAVAFQQGFRGQLVVQVTTQYVQPDGGQVRAQGLHACDERVGVAVSDAVVEVHVRRLVGRALQRLKPGQEWGDADSAGNPDLVGFLRPVAKVEATVGAFNMDGLAAAKPVGESARVVAERLDLRR